MQPSKRQVDNGTFKRGTDGRWYKLCTGPAHEVPEYLPATSKYYHAHMSGPRKGQILSRCRLCINWAKLKSPGSHHGYVPVEDVLHYYQEAILRIGFHELSKRSGVGVSTLENVIDGKVKQVKKATLRKIMLELVSMRRKGETSHSKSLSWRRDRRNNKHMELCEGCGTPKSNITKGCKPCIDRWYHQYKRGSVSEEEWLKIKARIE